jgi:CRP/FNR family cyclic AMP-dependent transcriptional regulator
MSDEDLAAFLAESSVFAGVPAPVRREVLQRASPREYRKGNFLFLQGDPGDELFVVKRGAVKVFVISPEGDEMVLATLRPPGVFGELSVLDGGPRSASVQAVMATTVLVLGRATLLELLRSQPALVDALLRSMGGLVRRLTDRAADLVFLDLEARVAKFLVQLAAERAEQDGDGRLVLDLNMTQGDLAAMVGGSRQSVNQILHGLARREYLEVRGQSLVLKDHAALARRAGRPAF